MRKREIVILLVFILVFVVQVKAETISIINQLNLTEGSSEGLQIQASNTQPESISEGLQIQALNTLTLNKNFATGGAITSNPAGISCGTTCSTQQASFDAGTVVTLIVNLASGFNITGWSGCDSRTVNNLQCSITMNAARTVSAIFSIFVPNSPSNALTTILSSRLVRLSWQDNSNDEDGFRIQSSFANGGMAISIGPDTIYYDFGVCPGEFRTFNVTSFKYSIPGNPESSLIYSVGSTNASATTPLDVPDTPSIVEILPLFNKSVLIGWNFGGCPGIVSATNVERSLSAGSGFSRIASVPASDNSGTILNYVDNSSTLNPNVPYYYRVNTSNSVGTPSYSNVVSVILGPPNTPYGASVIPFSTNTLEISWFYNSTDESIFNIERSLSAGFGFSRIANISGNGRDRNGLIRYKDGTALPNILYYYRVNATNTIGSSGYSNVASGKLGAPSVPKDLRAITQSNTTIFLYWEGSLDSEAFNLERSTTSSFSSFVKVPLYQPNSISTVDNGTTGLIKGTTYYYRINATNSLGSSPYSSTRTITFDNPTANPSNLNAVAVKVNVVNLTVRDNANNSDFIIVETSNISSSGPWKILDMISSSGMGPADFNKNMQLFYPAYPKGGNYYFRAYAKNVFGNSSGFSSVFGPVAMPTTWRMDIVKVGTGTGTVTTFPAGINCGGTCSAQFPFSTPITISAAPDSGSSCDESNCFDFSGCPLNPGDIYCLIKVNFTLSTSTCNPHPADINPQDWRIIDTEVSLYGSCWLTGCNWQGQGQPIDTYVSRAGGLWLTGADIRGYTCNVTNPGNYPSTWILA